MATVITSLNVRHRIALLKLFVNTSRILPVSWIRTRKDLVHERSVFIHKELWAVAEKNGVSPTSEKTILQGRKWGQTALLTAILSSPKVLRVARTLVDLEGADDISDNHVGEAVQYRSLDRQFLG